MVIIGCGKLGNIVVDALQKGLLSEYELVGVYSRTREKAEMLAARVKGCQVCDSLEELLLLNPDFLVEAASPAAMRQFALPALCQGISIVTLSIGAFADDDFYAKVMQAARENNAHVYIVSGASVVCGKAPESAYTETESGIAVVVELADGEKCDRCWMHSVNGEKTEDGFICSRCKSIVD